MTLLPSCLPSLAANSSLPIISFDEIVIVSNRSQRAVTDRYSDPMGEASGNPYGDAGEEVGFHAWQMLELFSQDLDPTWQYDYDAEALNNLLEMDVWIPHIRATGEVDIEEMTEFTQNLAGFGAALPLTAPERNWLVQRFNALDPYFDSVAKTLGGCEDEIVSGGIRRVVRGDELLKRWIAWRRQTGDYANQGTLDLAREALRGVVEKLVLHEPLPPSYVILRQIDKGHETE
jgi:hypothetical protein